jgi:hypothetical protein
MIFGRYIEGTPVQGVHAAPATPGAPAAAVPPTTPIQVARNAK